MQKHRNKYLLLFLIWSMGSSMLVSAGDRSFSGKAADYATVLTCAVPAICGCVAFLKTWWQGRAQAIAASQAARQAEDDRRAAIEATTAQAKTLEAANSARAQQIVTLQAQLATLENNLGQSFELAKKQADQAGMLAEDQAGVNLERANLQRALAQANQVRETEFDNLGRELCAAKVLVAANDRTREAKIASLQQELKILKSQASSRVISKFKFTVPVRTSSNLRSGAGNAFGLRFNYLALTDFERIRHPVGVNIVIDSRL